MLIRILADWLELSLGGVALWNLLLWYGERRSARRWSDLAPGYKPTLTLDRNAHPGGSRSRSGAGGSDAA